MSASTPSFGNTVRTLREKHGFGLRQFARMIELSPTFVSKFERGEFRPPAVEKIQLIAQLLETNPDALLASAGHVAPDVEAIIRKDPARLSSFLRRLAHLPASDRNALIKHPLIATGLEEDETLDA